MTEGRQGREGRQSGHPGFTDGQAQRCPVAAPLLPDVVRESLFTLEYAGRARSTGYGNVSERFREEWALCFPERDGMESDIDRIAKRLESIRIVAGIYLLLVKTTRLLM